MPSLPHGKPLKCPSLFVSRPALPSVHCLYPQGALQSSCCPPLSVRKLTCFLQYGVVLENTHMAKMPAQDFQLFTGRFCWCWFPLPRPATSGNPDRWVPAASFSLVRFMFPCLSLYKIYCDVGGVCVCVARHWRGLSWRP